MENALENSEICFFLPSFWEQDGRYPIYNYELDDFKPKVVIFLDLI